MLTESKTSRGVPARSFAPEITVAAQPGEREFITFGEFFQPLRSHWRLVVFSALLAMAAAASLALLQKPVYQSTVELEVQGLNQDFLDMKNFDLTATDNLLEPYLQTQVRILQSYSLLERVADRLQLRNHDEYKGGTNPFAAWPVLARFLSPNLPGDQSVVKKLSQHLTVRVLEGTHVIEVTCSSTDPKLACDLATIVSSEFIDETLSRRLRSTDNTAHLLTNQLRELKANLEQSEDALQQYARRVGLIFTSDKDSSDKDNPGSTGNVEETKLRDLQQAFSKAQDDRITAEARYQRVSSSPPDSLPEVLDDLTLRDYQVKLTDLKREAAELASTLAPGHYKVKEVKAQIAVLEAALERRRADLLERIKTQYESALSREQLLRSSYSHQADVVAALGARTVRYSMLKREVESNRSIYEAILQKVKEAGIISAVRTANVEVMDPARVPQLPSKPDPRLYGIAGLFAGAFAGTVLAFTRKSQSALPRLQEYTAAHPGLRELGVIPDANISTNGKLLVSPGNDGDHDGAGGLGSDAGGGLDLICWRDKQSAVAESMRASLASVLFSGSSLPPQMLAITSPSPGDGTTTVASNFAILLAGTSRRVLLVDANLRTPRLHQVFGAPNERGFSSLLREMDAKHKFQGKLYQQTKVAGLSLLPVGRDPFGARERLYSACLSQVFDRFREDFDAVVIDTAPLSHADSRPLARLADGVVLVIRSQQTSPDAVVAAQRLADDGTIVLGVVLNNLDSKV